MPISKLETELMRVIKIKQAQGESRPNYFVRLLQEGQDVTSPAWEELSADAQQWYNNSVKLYSAHNDPNDIREFPDLVPTTARATLTVVPPAAPIVEEVKDELITRGVPLPPEELEDEPVTEEEPIDNGDEEELPGEEEPEDDGEIEEEPAIEEPEEPVPLQTAAKPKPPSKKPAPGPTKPKPAVKTPGKPPVKIKAKSVDGEATRPPKPAAPGASTVIKRLLMKNPDVTNAELLEALRKHNIGVTAISISTIRSDFRHSLKVLHEGGYALEIPAP